MERFLWWTLFLVLIQNTLSLTCLTLLHSPQTSPTLLTYTQTQLIATFSLTPIELHTSEVTSYADIHTAIALTLQNNCELLIDVSETSSISFLLSRGIRSLPISHLIIYELFLPENQMKYFSENTFFTQPDVFLQYAQVKSFLDFYKWDKLGFLQDDAWQPLSDELSSDPSITVRIKLVLEESSEASEKFSTYSSLLKGSGNSIYLLNSGPHLIKDLDFFIPPLRLNEEGFGFVLLPHSCQAFL